MLRIHPSHLQTGPEELSSTAELAPYRKLWLAVILRAREDADGVNTNHQSEGGLRELKREGRQWLTGDTILRSWNQWDLELVCEMAGVESVTVIEMARRRYYGRETGGEEVL